MSWKRTIGRLLGRFWTRLVGDHDLILWVEKVTGMLAGAQRSALDSWYSGRALCQDTPSRERLPFVLLLRRSGEQGHPARPLLDVLNGASAAELDAAAGWSLKARMPFPRPVMLSDHVVGAQHALFAGVDFDVANERTLVLYDDPETMGWETVALQDADGGVSDYYRLFGWARPEDAVEDAVAAFEAPELAGGDLAEVAWRVHQNGATMADARLLLGMAGGCVVCRKSGIVHEMWDEDGGARHCAVIGDVLYASTLSPAPGIVEGASVLAGDTVFGDMVCVDGHDAATNPELYDAIPGIYVTTDAGSLYARNASMAADTRTLQDGSELRTLPLRRGQTGTEAVGAYVARCAELASDDSVPKLDVPATVNPCRFVLDRLRAGCFFVAMVAADGARKLSAALRCLRRSSAAGGFVDVYIRATGEPATATMSPVGASALRAAVSVSATAMVSAECNARTMV